MNSFEIDLVNMDELCKLLEIEISAFQNFQQFIFTVNELIKSKKYLNIITMHCNIARWEYIIASFYWAELIY